MMRNIVNLPYGWWRNSGNLETVLTFCKIWSLIQSHIWNKAVLELRVSPDFAITYFCNHCNIRFENTDQSVWIHWPFFPKTWTKGHWPLDDLWPHVCWGHMCDSTQGSLCPSPMTIHQCMWIQWSSLQNTTYIHIHTYTYYVQNEWSHSLLLNSVQARQKGKREKNKNKKKNHQVPDIGKRVWELLEQIYVPVLLSIRQHCHVLDPINIPELGYWFTANVPVLSNTGPFQYLGLTVHTCAHILQELLPSLGHTACWQSWASHLMRSLPSYHQLTRIGCLPRNSSLVVYLENTRFIQGKHV